MNIAPDTRKRLGELGTRVALLRDVLVLTRRLEKDLDGGVDAMLVQLQISLAKLEELHYGALANRPDAPADLRRHWRYDGPTGFWFRGIEPALTVLAQAASHAQQAARRDADILDALEKTPEPVAQAFRQRMLDTDAISKILEELSVLTALGPKPGSRALFKVGERIPVMLWAVDRVVDQFGIGSYFPRYRMPAYVETRMAELTAEMTSAKATRDRLVLEIQQVPPRSDQRVGRASGTLTAEEQENLAELTARCERLGAALELHGTLIDVPHQWLHLPWGVSAAWSGVHRLTVKSAQESAIACLRDAFAQASAAGRAASRTARRDGMDPPLLSALLMWQTAAKLLTALSTVLESTAPEVAEAYRSEIFDPEQARAVMRLGEASPFGGDLSGAQEPEERDAIRWARRRTRVREFANADPWAPGRVFPFTVESVRASVSRLEEQLRTAQRDRERLVKIQQYDRYAVPDPDCGVLVSPARRHWLADGRADDRFLGPRLAPAYRRVDGASTLAQAAARGGR